MKVAFIGLGSMGMPMAANLARAGHDLTVWNRSRKTPEGFEGKEPPVAGSIAEAVRDAEAVVTMLANDQAVTEVVHGGLLDNLRQGAVHLSMSTLSVAAARTLAEEHAKKGRDYVAAPVFGRPEMAAAAKLWIVLAGPARGVATIRPLLDALGRGVSEFGEEPWKANLVKLGNNFMLTAMIETLGETFALMRKAGIPPKDFLAAINNLFQSPVYQNYGTMIADGQHEAGFKMSLGLKDVRLALAAADELHVPMPFASVARDNMVEAVATGGADKDWSYLARVVQDRAGLD
ncbi:3-hydroxyisobutyrate dehydrogenase [Faunimonas pinastri]|uniref:3-hydroxyisobutyrate dehydrogenase n=1 Tax=Faunimonas pinastri TaxID=1855383 RepID=A0A1H9P4U9_9HYPH|nr:NAD(P)-dependent oxidoreductase [Faunimonas pinastri]SER42603.1 3-hydroxyisobutyrate dehydrogenase [Faunimonas pinastri]